MSDNNIKKLLRGLVDPVQGIETALQQLLTDRAVNTAVGVQLDILGRVVGQARGGMVDNDYRRLVRARISVNRSKGTIADVIAVAELVVDNLAVTYQVDNQGIAAVVIRLYGAPVTAAIAALLIPMLRETVSAGVRILVEYSPNAFNTWFQWDTAGRGWDQGTFLDALD